MKKRLLAFALMLLASSGLLRAANTRPKAQTLPRLMDGRTPRHFDGMWAGFDSVRRHLQGSKPAFHNLRWECDEFDQDWNH